MVELLGYTISLTIPELLLLIAIFALFLIVTRKIVKTIFSMVWIAIASAAFPFVMRFMGLNFSTDLNSIIFFVALGIGLYFVYMVGRIVYAMLGIVGKVWKALPIMRGKKNKEEKMVKRVEKLWKEKKW